MPPLVVAIEEADVERPGEVRAEVVAGAHLQRAPVAHQRLAGQRHLGAWELLGFALAAPDRRDREPVVPDLAVHAEHPLRFLAGLGRAGMERVAFLPQEFGRAQERPRAELPAHHVRPLVHEHGQVAIALDQVAVDGADHCLGGGPDREALGELVGATVGDPGDLRAEPFDMLRLGLQEALGHE